MSPTVASVQPAVRIDLTPPPDTVTVTVSAATASPAGIAIIPLTGLLQASRALSALLEA